MPVAKGRMQISVTLTDEQIALIDSLVDGETNRTRADVIRKALAAYFGNDWPDIELRWGGFTPEIRAKRWSKKSGS